MIETERLILRKPVASDIEEMIAFYQSERASMAGGNVSYPDAIRAAYSLFGHWEHRGYGLFAVTVKGDDTAIGLAGPYYPPHWPETEVGWVLFEGHEGRGYATEAARASVAYVRDTLKWTEIVHYIDPENPASVAVAERIGSVLDPHAKFPKPELPCLVYRQPRSCE